MLDILSVRAMERRFTRFLFATMTIVVASLILVEPGLARSQNGSIEICDFADPSDVANLGAPGAQFAVVADTGNNGVRVLGAGCSSFPFVDGGADPGFAAPSGVAVDPDGRIYVADTGNDRILRFGSIAGLDSDDVIDLQEVYSVGLPLDAPEGLGADDAGLIYIANTGAQRVQIIDSAGFSQGVLGVSDNGNDTIAAGEFLTPSDVAVCGSSAPGDLAGRIFVSDRGNHTVHAFATDGTALFRFGNEGDAAGQMQAPRSVAVDPLCNVYVADTGNSRVQMFDGQGGYLETLGTVGQVSGIAVAPFGGISGAIYFSTTSSDDVRSFEYINYDTDGNGNADDDADGLPDIWEADGIDLDFDGTVELDLPALGADPNRKTVFVEVDFMEFHALDAGARDDVIEAFAQSPVDNPDGSTGITLILEEDEELAHQNSIEMWGDFNDLKEESFGTAAQRALGNAEEVLAAKRLAYRYAMIIHNFEIPSLMGSQAGTGGFAELGGNDFVLSLGNWDCNDPSDEADCTAPNHRTGSPRAQGYGFMHELGHSLNLTHGGHQIEDENGDGNITSDDEAAINCKPNYISIMSYSYVSLGIPDVDSFNPVGELVGRLDYSAERLPDLLEDALNESDGISDGSDYTVWSSDDGDSRLAGLGDEPLDWDGDGQIDPALVNSNINRVGIGGCDSEIEGQLRGFDDWANLGYGFRSNANFADGVQVAADTRSEFNFQTAKDVRQIWQSMFEYRYVYSAKFLCVPLVGPEGTALSPGRYQTSINVHNPSTKDVRFLKKAVIARNENDRDRGRITPLEEDMLADDEAISIDCTSIAARFEQPQPVGDGFVVIKSNEPLDVVAVYTSRDSVDVERIVPTEFEDKEEPNGDDEPRKRADLTITLPTPTRLDCPNGPRSCVHSLEVDISNQGSVAAPGPFDVLISLDTGQSVTQVIAGLAAGASSSFVANFPAGSSCYNPNCTVTGEVDAGDVVPETNETNNVAKREDRG